MVVFDGTKIHLSARGDLLAIAAALCWAVYSLFMGEMTHEYGALTVTRKVFFYGLLTILPFIGERMSAVALIGSLAILAGVIWAGRQSAPPEFNN